MTDLQLHVLQVVHDVPGLDAEGICYGYCGDGVSMNGVRRALQALRRKRLIRTQAHSRGFYESTAAGCAALGEKS